MKHSQSLVREILFIVALSVVFACVYNVFSAKSIPIFRKDVVNVAVPDSVLFGARGSSAVHAEGTDTVIAPLHQRALANPDSMAKVVATEKQSKQVFHTITLDQMKRLMAEKHPLILDARDTAAYRKGHVKGARNYFGEEAGEYFSDMVTIPRDTLIIMYCNNPACHLGRMLGEFMGEVGFTNLLLYDDGWDGWVKGNMPIDSTNVPAQ